MLLTGHAYVQYNPAMPEGRDPTAQYLRLLIFATVERSLIEKPVLQMLLESQRPSNPMDASLCAGSPEDRFAFGQAFQKVLLAKQIVDWDRVKLEIHRLVRFLDRQDRHRLVSHFEARWLRLPENNFFFSTARWCSSWSRRDVESLLCFFHDDGSYYDPILNCSAHAKTGLRRFFSQFFHAFEGKVTITSAKFAACRDEIELELGWLRTGRRIPAPDLQQTLGSGSLRGNSYLWLVRGKIAMCIDRSSIEDLEQMSLGSLGFQQLKGSETITHTDTTVVVNNVKLLKTIQFKKSSSSPESERN